jgi:PAS domain S-box-containing protein
MNVSQGPAPTSDSLDSGDVDLRKANVRIAQLEREAIEQGQDTAKGLRAHLDRYESLVLAIAQVIWTHDDRGEMVGDQPSWAAYTGQTRVQYARRGWLDAVHPDDHDQNGVWERAVATRTPCQLEHRLRRHDGQYRYFSVRAVPVFREDGSVREWAGIHTDITERRLTEHALREGERRFRELADAMPQIVWGARADGFVDYYNRRWYDFTGRPEEGAGDDTWGAVHPADRPEAVRVWHAAIQSGESCEIESRLKRRDGEYRWYVTRAVPARDVAGKVTRWLGTCTDIDARVRSEEDLRGLAAMLAQSNRELEDFASVASHDLQEPLRKIQSFAERMRDEAGTALGVDVLDYLDRIQNAATRMRTLVDDLLEFSRFSAKGKPFFQVDLNEVAAGVVSDLEARREETGGVVEVGPLPIVFSDRVQMRQLLQNLIGNALKFHRKGKAPLVRVSAEVIEGAPDASGRTSPGGNVCLRVADNGIGFDEKYLDRVFKIFQRLHGRGEYDGSGIGLAICRKIAERHGGTITAQSKPGEGATFIVTLPLAQKAQGGAHVD